MKWPRVETIILNWNGWKDTIECLESVYKLDYPNFQVVVVDNGSWDNSVEEIKAWVKKKLGENQVFVEYTKESALQGGVEEKEEALERVTSKKRMVLIRNNENFGFAGGNNVAIHYALQRKYSVEYVFLLNNDAKVEKDCLENLVKVDFKADAGVVGSIVKDKPKGKVLFAGVKGSYPLLRQFFQPLLNWNKISVDSEDEYWTSFWLSGSGMLIRGDVLRDVKSFTGRYFDDRLFLYGEEIDFCHYTMNLGFNPIMVKHGIHYHGNVAHSSGGLYNPIFYYYVTRNRIFLANEMLTLPLKVIFHPFNVLTTLGKVLKNLVSQRFQSSLAILRGLVDGYRGVMGKWKYHDEEVKKFKRRR